jgi:hypothetical protein
VYGAQTIKFRHVGTDLEGALILFFISIVFKNIT